MRTLFYFLWFVAAICKAEEEPSFYDKQVAPVLERATDQGSLSLLGAGTLSVLLAQPYDNQMRDQFRDHQKMDKNTSRLGDEFGTYGVSLLIAGTQFFVDKPNGESHLRALVYVTLVGTSMKLAFQKERPNGANKHSFPSGHTYSAFATATSLSYAYGWKAGAIAYPLAVAVGMSRMSDNVHWFSDVVGGMFLGIYIGRATYYDEIKKEKPTTSAWFPSFENDQAFVHWMSQF